MATQPGRGHGDPGEVLPLGPDALVVRFATTLDERANRAAVGLARYLSGAGREGVGGAGVSEVASAPASVLVRFDPRVTDRVALTARLHATLRECDWRSEPLAAGRAWRVPACFGGAFGPKLAEAASLAGLGETAAVADLCARPLRVLAIGFAPGQPYLGPLGPAWDIARRTALTRRVPTGALVVAVRQVVLFANASPTGWRHVGQTAFRPFRPGSAGALRAASGRYGPLHCRGHGGPLGDPRTGRLQWRRRGRGRPRWRSR